MEVDEDADQQEVRLTAGQQGLFQVCQRDLLQSSSNYAHKATLHSGQQMLVDLKCRPWSLSISPCRASRNPLRAMSLS